MPSSYSLESSASFNGAPEVVYEFLLFFFQQPPDPKFKGSGSVGDPERVVLLKRGARLATEWSFPKSLLIEELGSPFLTRSKLTIHLVGDQTRVSWTMETQSRNVLEKLFIAIHRRQIRRNPQEAQGQHSAIVARLCQEFEQREQSGIGEHFEAYRKQLNDG